MHENPAPLVTMQPARADGKMFWRSVDRRECREQSQPAVWDFDFVLKGRGFSRAVAVSRRPKEKVLLLGGTVLQRCGNHIVLTSAAEVTLFGW